MILFLIRKFGSFPKIRVAFITWKRFKREERKEEREEEDGSKH